MNNKIFENNQWIALICVSLLISLLTSILTLLILNFFIFKKLNERVDLFKKIQGKEAKEILKELEEKLFSNNNEIEKNDSKKNIFKLIETMITDPFAEKKSNLEEESEEESEEENNKQNKEENEKKVYSIKVERKEIENKENSKEEKRKKKNNNDK